MNNITVKAYAKLNLSLDITGAREDGYHLLSSVMQTVNLSDTLILEKSDKITLDCTCPGIPIDDSNLAVRAAKKFFSYTGLDSGVHIKLKKVIPHGAGMGGGSSDAAAVLKGLNILYETDLDRYELCELGIKLGADVPFCIYTGTALVTGIGESIVALKDIFQCHIIIVKPDFSICTPEAYSAYDNAENIIRPDTNKILQAIYEDDINEFCDNIGNVLEAATDKPEIQQIKAEIMDFGAKVSCMTGSGSAVFGIFDAQDIAERCAEKLKGKYPHVYLCNPCKE